MLVISAADEVLIESLAVPVTASAKPNIVNGKLVSDPICSSSKNTKIEIFGITVNQVVTIVGTPSYTSGAQLWKGAAATLNKNPTPINSTPSTIPCEIFSCPVIVIDDAPSPTTLAIM